MATIRTAIELEDRLSGVLNGVLNSVNVTVSAIEKMNGSLNKPIEGSYFKEIRDSIAQTSVELGNLNEDMERTAGTAARVPAVPHMQPAAGAVEWQTDNLNVFTNTGIERFKQEIQSAEAMLRGISESQLNIAANSEQTSVFPAAMTKDMQNMQARITAVQNKVREIGAKPINLVTAADSAMLEQLRGQLAGITNEQESLNAAVEAMDVSEANQAYLRLSRTVGNTERYIRDNAAEQERFNRKIESGIGGSDRLTQSIKGMAAAYISVQSLGKVLGLSDELTQTTARLNMMNDGQRTTAELQEMIFQSAQRSRGSYKETADAVAKLGLMAGNAFGSSAEVVAFMEQVNKQFRIAGTGADGVRAAMLQLTQAMGSGVLRGEEFNSIFEQAPTIMQSIAGYLDVPIGKLRDMAAEGEITAGVVKAAMFEAAEETNAKFECMPMTFEQVWTSFENKALMAFQPVLDRLSEIANSDKFQEFADNAAESLADVADTALDVLDGLIDVANFVSDNWSVMGPIIWGVAGAMLAYEGATKAAKVAQDLFNTSLNACPLIWIITGIFALLTVFQLLWDNCEGFRKFISNMWAEQTKILSVFYNSVIVPIANGAIDIQHQLMGAVRDLCVGIVNLFAEMAIGVIENIDWVKDSLKGMIDMYNSIASTMGWKQLNADVLLSADGIDSIRNETVSRLNSMFNDMMYKPLEELDLENVFKGIDNMEEFLSTHKVSEIADMLFSSLFGENGALTGVGEGIGFGLGLGSDDFSDLYQGVYNIDDNTGDMADSLSMTDEELKYLRDIAERETINRFTTAEINFDMSGMQNTVNNDNDIDGIITRLTDEVTEAVFIVTEGVHG